jgi:hypothetical protein
MKNSPDAIATIHLYATAKGGRRGPTPASVFHTLLSIDERNFDARLYFEGSICPGDTIKVSIRFLYAEDAQRYFFVGKKFFILEGRVIGEGVIEEVSFSTE